jgi:YegS/Rv2252/BmrU family lipid kinase
MSPKDIAIIVNPVAGQRCGRLLRRVTAGLTASGASHDIAETRSVGDARDLARAAAQEGYRTVVAAGGDGTIAEVVDGLRGSEARLGIVPIGTANVFAHELGVPFEAGALVNGLKQDFGRLVWPGVVRIGGRERLFVQMVGVGFDARVVDRVSKPLKRLLGRSAYVVQAVREALTYPFEPVRLLIDGQETTTRSVVISKGRLYGGRHMLAPDASPFSSGFTVALFDHLGPGSMMSYGMALATDRLSQKPDMRYIRAHTIEVLNEDLHAQADGDVVGIGALTINDNECPVHVAAASSG